MKKIARTLSISVVVVFLLFVGLAVICFKFLDTTPYRQTEFYKKELALLNSKQADNTQNDSLPVLVGWSSINLLPPFTTPIAIDAHRRGKHFEGVHDSIYVRAFVFKQGNYKIAYISADLLIIPPTVTKLFDTILKAQGFDTENIFFAATHTHTSIGAWYPTYVGEIFAGRYDARVPEFIAASMSKAILEAEKKCSSAKIGYGEFATQHLVFNRLVKERGQVDSLLRVIKIEKQTGEGAAIITFAAHNTVFHENLMKLSADWCGAMMKQLNQSGKIQFASFSAGAVGSQGPVEVSENQEAEAKYMANGLAKIILSNYDSIKTTEAKTLRMIHLPLLLREANLRVSQCVVVRPWLFKKLFGAEDVYINSLRLGDVFLAGMPCDFSGELVAAIDSAADNRNLKLMITSFNGGYMGYVTDSKWYRLNTYETRTMGWFGDKNGEYLSEVVMRMMEKSKQATFNN